MFYPADAISIVLPLQKVNGTSMTVTFGPKVNILKATDGTVVISNASMSAVPGTSGIYHYLWTANNVTDGTYIVFASYTADGLVVQDLFLKTIELGDSRVTDVVAKNSTVAKDATVAKSATVLAAEDYVSPDDSDLVQSIKSRLDEMPASIASASAVAAVAAKLAEVWQASFGDVIVNKDTNTMVILNADQSPLATFDLENDDTHSARIRA